MGKTYQSIVINAPVEDVWRAVRDFHDMSYAPNVFTSVEDAGDHPGDEVGAVRILNGAFVETLLELDDEGRTFCYSIDDGPSPVSKDEVKDYVGRMRVSPTEGGASTLVEWSSSWEPCESDEAVYDFCHGVYVAALDDMKKSL